jgi:hypothetical protein
MKITTAAYIPNGRCIQAIDILTRNEDGSVGKKCGFSKKQLYYRQWAGLYDGGGVEPDVTQSIEPSPIIRF